MTEGIPITPPILIWARERAGLSRDELIDKFPRYANWEIGNSFPTYAQLEKLAETFKVPIAVFFFPKPPEVPSIAKTFRTLPESEVDNFPSRMHMLLRKAKFLQLSLDELTEGKNPSSRLITRDLNFAPNSSIEEMAAAVRSFIGISIEDQQKWNDTDTALKEWRSALLNVGIFVFKDAFKLDEYSGFCLYDTTFPIIYVNNSSAKTRQIFTYFHELAHLLFHTSGIDPIDVGYINNLSDEQQQIEIICNRFASEFLLPGEAFNKASALLDNSERSAETLASLFHVSRETIFRRFLDKGLIQARQYNTAVQRWNLQHQTGGSGGDYYWTKLSYLGKGYVGLALRQFHRNKINENELAEYLVTKPKNVGVLEEYFEKGGV
ncbi:MAG: XRE family transcriptional regulator [Candidatus Melainabacteria bacterium]|nr:XRE family transcriptional regulator [Candidatus Melainabacteria bacterium]